MQKRIEFARERHFICSCRNKRAINSVSLPVYNTSLKGFVKTRDDHAGVVSYQERICLIVSLIRQLTALSRRILSLYLISLLRAVFSLLVPRLSFIRPALERSKRKQHKYFKA